MCDVRGANFGAWSCWERTVDNKGMGTKGKGLRGGRAGGREVCVSLDVPKGQVVGVIGTSDHGMREALFLRGFTRDVTLIAPDAGPDPVVNRPRA